MSIYYVATNGSNGGIGSFADPWRTLLYALTRVGAGDLLWIRGGSYPEAINVANGATINSGTAGNVLTVKGYTNETVVINPVSSANSGVLFLSGTSYTNWQDLVLDGQGLTNGGFWTVLGISNSSLHNTFTNIEGKNSMFTCMSVAHASHNNSFINCEAHEYGRAGLNQDHGMYITSGSQDTLVDGGRYHDGYGFCVHSYTGDATRNDRTIVRNARLYNCGFKGGLQNSNTSIAALLFADGDNCAAYNNLVYRCIGAGLQSAFGGGAAGTLLYNNSLYDVGNVDTQPAIDIGASSSGAVLRNNIMYSCGAGIADLGSSTKDHNITTDPKYLDAPNGDLSLQATSTNAIGAGVDLTAVFTTDFAGNTRPSGTAWCDGAYEFAPALALIEDFTYTTTNDLSGKNGGTGWSSAWVKVGGSNAITAEVGPAGASGNAARSNSGLGAVSYYRDFAAVATGTFSWQMRSGSTTPNDFRGVALDTSSAYLIFVKFGPTGYIQAKDSTAYTNLLAYATDTWYFIEVQLDGINQPNQFRVRINNGTWSGWLTANGGTMTTVSRFYIQDNPVGGGEFWVDGIGSTYSADTTAPTLSSIAAGVITSTSAVITWLSSEGADGQVEYGLTTGYGASSTLDATIGLSHTQGLTGLAPGTTYHYRVKSRDVAGNLATSTDKTFATSAAPVEGVSSEGFIIKRRIGR